MRHPLTALFILVSARVTLTLLALIVIIAAFAQFKWSDVQVDSPLGTVRVITFRGSLQVMYWSPFARGWTPQSYCRVSEYPHTYKTNRNFIATQSSGFGMPGGFVRFKDAAAGPNHWLALTSVGHPLLLLTSFVLCWWLRRLARSPSSPAVHNKTMRGNCVSPRIFKSKSLVTIP